MSRALWRPRLRIDAVDLSPRMIAEGRRRTGGRARNLAWIEGSIEEARLNGPYDLIVAGESVHWFDWRVVIPRFAHALAPHGHLAIVVRNWFRAREMRDRLQPIYRKYGANRDFLALDPVLELERRELFSRVGEHTTASSAWHPNIEEVIGCHHSQNGFDVERMNADDVRPFDREIAKTFQALVEEGLIRDLGGRFDLDLTATITWGKPIGP